MNTPFSAADAIARGDTLRDQGDLYQALHVYRQALRAGPDQALGHYKMGTAYLRLERHREAESSFRKALALQPRYHEASNNLGIVLTKRGAITEAEGFYRQTLADQPDYFEPHINLGNLLTDQSRFSEALYLFRRAVQLRPDSGLARDRLGQLLRRLGRVDEALRELSHAVGLAPTLASAWNNLGTAHVERGECDAAALSFSEAMRRQPGLIAAWNNRMLVSNWRSEDKEEVFRLHQSFGRHMQDLVGSALHGGHSNSTERDRPLRVGFVSGDFRRHSVSYFVETLLQSIDRRKIEPYAYFTAPQGDDRTEQMQPLFASWRHLYGQNDAEAAETVRQDRIDILVDLSGHTTNNRLGVFARRPAPIQVSWIGYPNTTGLETIDYRLTDAYADPPGVSDAFHTEKLWRLPGCFLCYSPPPDAPEPGEPPSRNDQPVVFGSFNARVKIGPETLSLWSRVLHAVPNSSLCIKSINGLNDAEGKDQFMAQLSAAGIDTHRVQLLASEARLADHLALYRNIDICLDTYPYHGTTTTCEALWMGVPVVTLSGDRHAARVGASLMNNAGLPQLVAVSEDDYVSIAAELAGDRERLAELRRSMRPRLTASPLLDNHGLARKLENAFRDMWAVHCDRFPNPDTSADYALDCVVNLQGGFRMLVSNDIRGISTWVALEQEDWFEDEIRFLREACRPDWQALDIGANHGIYSLSLAASGANKVWAFEPTSEPMGRFRRSIALNGFQNQIQAYQLGLSDSSRTVEIELSARSELNSLNSTIDGTGKREQIELTDLDSFLERQLQGETKIDFVKIDAEGEEVAILRGSGRFFSQQTPLVMFEFKHGNAVNTELIAAFRSLGYIIYRLVPGPGFLAPVPADSEAALDSFVLNLFACRDDRAQELAAAGLLLIAEQSRDEEVRLDPDWFESLASLPAVRASAAAWNRCDIDTATAYNQALLAWCGSRQLHLSIKERFALLTHALGRFQASLEDGDDHPAVALLGIRICADAGRRMAAVELAISVAEQISADEMPTDRPVPPALDAFDLGLPKSTLAAYLHQSVVEYASHRGSHSRFFIPTPAALLQCGFDSPEHSVGFERHVVLCSARDGLPLQLASSALIFQSGRDNLNSELWRQIAQDWGFLVDSEQTGCTPAAIIAKAASVGPICLHIGGTQARQGWMILNAQTGKGVDFVGDIRDLDSFPDASCGAVYCSHVLEHIALKDMDRTLQGLHRILIPGGKAYISVPDLDTLCRIFVSPEMAVPERTGDRIQVMRKIFGGQLDAYDYHYVGLNLDFLLAFLRDAGFHSVEQVEHFGLFDDASDLTIDGVPISLNLIAEKAA